jgi:nucleotide-binding universal stress UspA family protein
MVVRLMDRPPPLVQERAMLPVSRVLHPTDFSEPSRHALELACSLARDYGARLTLLHIVAPTLVCDEGFVPPDSAAFAAAWSSLEQVRPPDPGVIVERHLVEGDPAAEIVRAAGACDLLVMGTHGRTGLGRLLMGSVAEQVVRRAPCPVVTVKTPAPRPTAMPTADFASDGWPCCGGMATPATRQCGSACEHE